MAKDSYLVGLIGSGIGPSLSPALHEREADRQGLRYLYRLIDIDTLGVPPEAVGDLLRAARDLGFDGLNITHPCKQHVIGHLDALAPQAEALGAVNTVVFDDDGRAIGHNTDITGFAASFARGLPDAPLQRIVQLGAGGAGAAVAHATLNLGAGRVTVVDAMPDRAADLAASLNRRFGDGRATHAAADRLPGLLAAADGVVHATPTGSRRRHRGAAAPAGLHRLRACAVAAARLRGFAGDRLLARARARGGLHRARRRARTPRQVWACGPAVRSAKSANIRAVCGGGPVTSRKARADWFTRRAPSCIIRQPRALPSRRSAVPMGR
ncbi:Shikimate dehydrogenase (NADP(+)) [Streptomyces tendae]